MSRISQASRHQSEGTARIDSMVSQMGDVTRQDAAMVGQAAAAAASLQGQAALMGMAHIFKATRDFSKIFPYGSKKSQMLRQCGFNFH